MSKNKFNSVTMDNIYCTFNIQYLYVPVSILPQRVLGHEIVILNFIKKKKYYVKITIHGNDVWCQIWEVRCSLFLVQYQTVHT